VISESGTDVEIDDIDEDDEREDDEEGDDERAEDRENALNASFDGTVTAGENVTLSVTQDGDSVEGAIVFVDGKRAGTTDANGAYVIQVPADAGVEVSTDTVTLDLAVAGTQCRHEMDPGARNPFDRLGATEGGVSP
jgi:hypothetical protein